MMQGSDDDELEKVARVLLIEMIEWFTRQNERQREQDKQREKWDAEFGGVGKRRSLQKQ